MFLRRNVSVENEDGLTYSITICIEDESHPLQGTVCAVLEVTFVSKYISTTHPHSIHTLYCFAFTKFKIYGWTLEWHIA